MFSFSVISALLLFGNLDWVSGVSDPGFRAALTAEGLNYIQEIGIPLLKKELADISIPDISGRTSFKIGHLHYKVYQIGLTSFNIGSSSLKTSPGDGLTLTVADISIAVSAHWSYKALHIHDHGSVTASAGDINLSIGILLKADATGHPTVNSTSCTFDAGHLHIKLHGGASWFYNLFDKSIAGSIRKELNKKVCDIATKSINTAANKELATLPLVVKIDDVSELSYGLTKSPTFNDTFIMTHHKGEFLSVSNPSIEAPFSPSPLPSYSGSNKMVTMWVTDYVVNTAILVYKRANYLTYNITADMVSKLRLPLKLDTNYFQPMVHQLYNKYPNKSLTLGVRAVEKQPLVTITPGGVNFTLPGAIDFFVMNGDSTPLAFTLGLTSYLDLKVRLVVDPKTNYLNVSANCTNFIANFNVLESNIGDFEVSKLQNVMDAVIKLVIIPQINKRANAGFPIPIVQGLHFENPTLSLGKGYLVVESDVSYVSY